MMILVAVIFLYVLVSLAVYVYLSVFGVFNTSYLKAFQVAVYILLIYFALTIGIGIEYVLRNLRPSGNPLAVVE
jgi:hypothetical protein